jgi:hypothetical protein
MTHFKSTWLFAAIVALGCLTSNARSDSGPTPATATADQNLTDASLEAMLRGMGYEPTSSKSSSGKRTYYRLILKEDTFTFVFDLSLEVDRSRVAFSAPLPVVKDRDQVPAERLWKLLESNDDIAPAGFSFDKDRKRIYLNMAIDNRGITSAVLRKEITQFTRIIERTCPQWKDIQPVTAPATPPITTPAATPANPPAATPANPPATPATPSK